MTPTHSRDESTNATAIQLFIYFWSFWFLFITRFCYKRFETNEQKIWWKGKVLFSEKRFSHANLFSESDFICFSHFCFLFFISLRTLRLVLFEFFFFFSHLVCLLFCMHKIFTNFNFRLGFKVYWHNFSTMNFHHQMNFLLVCLRSWQNHLLYNRQWLAMWEDCEERKQISELICRGCKIIEKFLTSSVA